MIYLIRHAESIANTQGIYQGQSYNTGLSLLGKKQALALANALSGFADIRKVVASPLLRTKETATVISEKCGVPLEFDERLLETDHGLWEGKKKDWLTDNYSDIMKAWKKKPLDVTFPQGESFAETVERVRNFLFDNSWVNGTVVVTHDNIVRIITSLVNGLDINKMWEIEIDPAAISILKVEKPNGRKTFQIVKVNQVEHLDNLRADLAVHSL